MRPGKSAPPNSLETTILYLALPTGISVLAIVSKTSGEDDEGFGALIHRIQVGLGSMSRRAVAAAYPRPMALLLDPRQDFVLRETYVGLDLHVRDQTALDVSVNGLYVDLQYCFQLPSGKKLRHIAR